MRPPPPENEVFEDALTWYPEPGEALSFLVDRYGSKWTVVYTNWREVMARRVIVPICLWYGNTKWHEEDQWLLTATDVAKGDKELYFAVESMAIIGGVQESEDENVE